MTRVGLAYQSPLRSFMERTRDAFDFIEVVPDMFWNDLGPGHESGESRYPLSPEGAQFIAWAQALGKPVIPHSIGLSIGSARRFDRGHVQQMARWRQLLPFAWHSDHLSFHLAEHSGGGEANLGITLPLGFDREVLDLLVLRIREVRALVPEAPFLLENSVWYVQLDGNELTEAAFLNQLCADSGAGLLLDLHNLYTNGRNGITDPERFLDELDLDQVREIHVAGGMELDGFYLDAHSGAVPEPVWRLLDRVLPQARRLEGVTFEIFGSWFAEFGEAALARELTRLRRALGHEAQMAEVA